MTKDQRKIKIGMEVEASDLDESTATDGFKKALATAGRDFYWFKCDVMGTRTGARFSELPAKFRVPEGWTKETDGSCGMEIKFHGPTESISEAEERIEKLASWFANIGVERFENAGTHVHLGIFDWINRHVEDTSFPLGMRARQLLYGYFLTRERAIFELVPVSRRINNYCPRGIPLSKSMNLGGTHISTQTPAWAIHNALLSQSQTSRFQVGGATMNQRHLPTFEFRMFPGCGSEVALKGYVRLIWTMFQNVAPLILEEKALRTKGENSKVFVTNPLTFTAKDLKSEISDSWLKTWIDETLDNDGSPISTEISASSGPQRLATV